MADTRSNGPGPWCCVMECREDAEFDIFGGSGHFEDNTQACEDHVGSLLGTADWLAEDNTEWTVVLLQPTRG